MVIKQGRWRPLAWLLFAAFAGHNLEEVLAMPAYAARMAGRLPLPDPRLFQLAVAAVTVAGMALVAHGHRRGRPEHARVLAWIMLINVPVPHLPAAIYSGGYAPGLVTALLLNLPIAAAYLWLTRPARGPEELRPDRV